MKLNANQSTRERLIEAARDLFYHQGYAATGIAQILRQADAKPGSLYHFFPTKEDLLIAVLQTYKELLWPIVIQPVFDRISDPIERIFGVLDGYRSMLRITRCTRGCPIGNIAIELADSHPQVRQLCAENFSGWRDAIRGCLDAAADRLPESTDREQLASLVLTIMEGGVMQARAYQSLDPFDAAVTQLRDYIERLLTDGTRWSPRHQPNDAGGDPGDALERGIERN
jgi:AcrR family transcriptional regulator